MSANLRDPLFIPAVTANDSTQHCAAVVRRTYFIITVVPNRRASSALEVCRDKSINCLIILCFPVYYYYRYSVKTNKHNH